MRFPGEDEKWGVGSAAPVGNEEDKEDPETDEWDSKFEEVAANLIKWYESG
jgi:hypothetical protein